MNILITGASGFLGLNFLNYIKENNLFKNDEILLLSSKEIDGYNCLLHNNYTFNKEDFKKNCFSKIDVLFHLGASTPKSRDEFKIDYAYKFALNVKNTIHLYENLPNIPEKIVFISSVSVYKDAPVIDENTEISTSDMYGASKIMCEKYLETMSKKDDFTLQILRLGQIYGPGEEIYSKIVSGFVKMVLNNELITIYGDGSDKRSLLNVKDCCKCIYDTHLLDKYISPVNIASSQAITINNIIDSIYSITGNEKNIQYKPSKISNSVVYLTKKMNTYFNIEEKNIYDGIKEYYEYYINKKE